MVRRLFIHRYMQRAMPNPPDNPNGSTVDYPPPADLQEEPTLTGPGKETPSRAPAPIEETPVPIRSFGDYELLSELGRGGMGIVYQARERSSGRIVALKMMLSEKADLNRFRIEARAAAELSHPGIVSIHSWGEHESHAFFTMDYVPGETLSRILERGPIPVDRAVRYMLGMARAVAAAHADGIIHRDLKPSNVIIDPSDQPRILDFGLAKRQFQMPIWTPRATEDIVDALPADAPAPISPQSPPRTEKGAILGTPAYMAPEQAKGKQDQIGPATDVHALGVLFYEMLTGRTPFRADNVLETLLQVEEQAPPSLCRFAPHVPAFLETICNRCLRKDPKARYRDAGTLADDLEFIWSERSQSRRFGRLTAIAAGALLVLLVCQWGLFHWLSAEPEQLSALSDSLRNRAGPMIAEAVMVLAGLLGCLLLVIGPLLAFLALLTWLGAWMWHSHKAWSALLVLMIIAIAGWVMCGFTAESSWFQMNLYLAAVTSLSAATAIIVRVSRPRAPSRAVETSAGPTEPFLQKLFAARVRREVPAQARSVTESQVELEDFEISKVLHRWPRGQVCRARQKSLDRPVLVWIETKSSEASLPGVVVRYPDVLALYAVSSGGESNFLVTEPAAGVPLSEWLLRRSLLPAEATTLAIRLARILQSFHEQGACHGHVAPEWILIRGEMEPLLCPCGQLTPSIQRRQHDLMALGKLLQEWLSPRPPKWRVQAQAGLYHVADAAGEGKYVRAKSLVDDLERAARAAQIHWRVRVATILAGVLAVMPLLVWMAERLTAPDEPWWSRHILLALSPSVALWGYTFCRYRIQGRRLLLHHVDNRSAGSLRGLERMILLIAPIAILVYVGLALEFGLSSSPWKALLAGAVLFGYWSFGMLIGGLVTAMEALRRSLRPESSDFSAAAS
jgi:serine/threonine protein kinase